MTRSNAPAYRLREMEFSGQTVLVTGAAGTLGRAVAGAFAERGANLVLLDQRRDLLERAFGSEDARRLFAPTDLLDQAKVSATVQAAIARFGRIDVLCNIAGGFRMGEPVHETTDATWTFLFDVNVHTLLNAVRVVTPHMIERGGGRIVNVGAYAAQRGVAQMGPYIAAKSAVIRLTETMAAELRERRRQRQLRPADHHRHAREPRGDARCRSWPMGRARRPGSGGGVPRIDRRAGHSRRGAARDRSQLKPLARPLHFLRRF